MKTKPLIHVAIADDHLLFRESISHFISQHNNIQVIIEAENGRVLLDKIINNTILPDICLLDINMPVMNGHETLIELQKNWPSVKVLVITMFDHEYSLIDMIKNGASGYLVKGRIGLKELQESIFAVYENGIYFPDVAASNIIGILQKKMPSPLELTIREKEFLQWCCQDMTYDEIAKKMNLSLRTIKGYKEDLFHKFKVKSRTGLVACAWHTGIISE